MGKKRKNQQKQARRAYQGALINRLNADWVSLSTSADSEIWSNLRTLRNRSRDLIRNNDYAISALRTILSNVLGDSGIRLQSKIKMQRGDKLNSNLNSTVEALWRQWQNKDFCDVSGRLSWPQLERLAMRSVIESGEVLIRKVPKSFRGSTVPLALQVIESDQLADDLGFMLRAEPGNQIRMGVELNQWNAPVAYWVYPFHPGDNWIPVGQSNRYTPIRIPADEIIHLYICDRPGQTRGVPWLAAAINRLRHMGGYEEAEIIKARSHACAMGFIQTPDASMVGAVVEGSPKKQLTFEPGTIQVLDPGESFTGFAPTSPNQALDPFLRFMLRAVAVGVGVSYEDLSGDYSQTTYGGQRAGMLATRDLFRVLQAWLSSELHQQVYEAWLDSAVMGRALSLPGYEAFPVQYNTPLWVPRGWSWIDPSKDVSASVDAITAGLSTLGRELASQGIDLEELVQERDREIELLKSKGIAVSVYPETAPQPPQPGGSAQGQPAQPQLPEGFTPVRSWDGRRAAKKCKAKPCGNTCISTSKACLQGLSAEQKKLAQKARNSMKAGKIGAAVDLPEQSAIPTVNKKLSPNLPKNHVLGPDKRVTTEKLDAALRDLEDNESRENLGKFRQFIELNSTKAVFYKTGQRSSKEQKDKISKEAGSRYSELVGPPKKKALGYTHQLANHVVISHAKQVQDFLPDKGEVKASVNKAIDNFKGNSGLSWHTASNVLTQSGQTLSVYLHEMGHQVHYAAGMPKRPEKAKMLTSYSYTNHAEFAAEHFVFWATSPKKYRETDPVGYAWVDKMMNDSLLKPRIT